MNDTKSENLGSIEQTMRILKLGGLAKEWRNVDYHDNEQYLCDLLDIEVRERGEYVRILDNLLRWKERKNAQKSEAEKWENTGRNTMRTSRRMRSSYRMQAQNR